LAIILAFDALQLQWSVLALHVLLTPLTPLLLLQQSS
jgi:hypothetical protein